MVRYQSYKWPLITAAVVAVFFGAYYFVKHFVAEELIHANYKVEVLQQDLKNALDQLEAEKAHATIAEREAKVVRQANGLLRVSERERQNEIASLQADLAFYRRLGGANGSQAPLAVHYLELHATESPRVYRMIFTLTQNLRWASVISGRVQLGVDGIRDEVAEHLTEKQLLPETSSPLVFKFKYFQQFERLITLPENFEPSQFTIRLKSGSLSTPVEQSAEWQSLFNQTTGNTAPNDVSGD